MQLLEHKIYDCPHKSTAQEMFWNKISHVELKKDETIVNIILKCCNQELKPKIGVAAEKGASLWEIMSFATCPMQLKNLL